MDQPHFSPARGERWDSPAERTEPGGAGGHLFAVQGERVVRFSGRGRGVLTVGGRGIIFLAIWLFCQFSKCSQFSRRLSRKSVFSGLDHPPAAPRLPKIPIKRIFGKPKGSQRVWDRSGYQFRDSLKYPQKPPFLGGLLDVRSTTVRFLV